MTAQEYYQAGRLAEAITRITEEIKANPGDQRARVFLFELLCFSGDLTRAQKQLDAISSNDVDAEIAVARYRNLLKTEEVRRNVCSGKSRPHFAGPVPAYAANHIDALKSIAEGNADRAVTLLEEVRDAIPSVGVQLDGHRSDDFGDGDDVLRPFLEAVIEGTYSWIPWESIRSLSLVQPKYLRDLYWMPARLELKSGQVGETFLPVLYAESYLDSDDNIRLGRMSSWRSDCPGLSLGIGQRVFVVDDTDRPMLEIGELEFDDVNTGDAS